MTPCSCMIMVVRGEQMMFAHATMADSHSPEKMAWQASWNAVSDDEQAVLMVTLVVWRN